MILKKFILSIFKFINFAVLKFYEYAIPEEIKRTSLTFEKKLKNLDIKLAYDYFTEDELKDSYNHFKKYFYTSVIVKNRHQARDYAIQEAIKKHKSGDYFLCNLE